jgi:hypothetical protein
VNLLPNKALHLTAGGGAVFVKVLRFIKVLFCLQSLVVILPAAGELVVTPERKVLCKDDEKTSQVNIVQ